MKNTLNFKKFINKNILCLDYGTKVIGMAQFTPGKDPFPLGFGRILVKNTQQVLEKIKKIVEEESFDIIIVGKPLHKDQNPSKMTQSVAIFFSQLQKFLPKDKGIEFYMHYEGLSSFEAKERMKHSPEYNFKINPKKIDEVAALVILEDFINS